MASPIRILCVGAGHMGRSHALAYHKLSGFQIVGLVTRSADARLFMVTDARWKFMHAEGGFRPMLFDLQNDPEEFVDLGASEAPEHREIIALMYERLGQWGRRMSQRVTRSEADITKMAGKSLRRGILLGLHDETDIAEELSIKYRGAAPKQRFSD